MQSLLTHRRWLVLIAVYVALLVGGWLVGQRLLDVSALQVRPLNEPAVHAFIMAAAGVFVLASATPFVPGAEVGFGLLMVFGARIALLVYACMVAALVLAYLVGRLVPATAIATAFGRSGFERARSLVMRMGPLDANGRLAMLTELAPGRAVPFLLRHRYLALLVLLNMPGNSVVGGGGGIALTAGMSGLFPLPGYLATVLFAVAPVPLLFWLGQGGG